MHKSTHFFGTSVFGQLISFIDDKIIQNAVKQHNSDYYIKKFKTRDHLISMLFCTFAKCFSLREVAGAMLGLAGKTKHFRLEHLPYRSTLSDANKQRDVSVFATIYHSLLQKYGHLLSDSRIKEVVNKQIQIFDSTTIPLFRDILKCVGRKSKNGKHKGGIKIHTIINVDETVPKVVWFTGAATNDHILLSKLELSPNIIYVFDKGYNDYKAYKLFTDNQTGFVTRIRDNAAYNVLEQNEIDECIHSGVLQDESIEITVKEKDNDSKLKLRKVVFYCTLIANLLMTVVQKKLKRSWAFSNLVSFVKIHLFNYIHLMNFLENPEKDWRKVLLKERQFDLFSPFDTS